MTGFTHVRVLVGLALTPPIKLNPMHNKKVELTGWLGSTGDIDGLGIS